MEKHTKVRFDSLTLPMHFPTLNFKCIKAIQPFVFEGEGQTKKKREEKKKKEKKNVQIRKTERKSSEDSKLC